MIEQERLEARIQELGKQISKDYEGKEILLVCVLKGGVMFMAQLAKYITVPLTMDLWYSPAMQRADQQRHGRY